MGGKKKKPKVKEIDGVLWLLDDNGNRLKKVRKKGHSDGHSKEFSAGDEKKKKKQNVKDIDGVLYQVDEHGNPIKKLRRKGRSRDDPLTKSERRRTRSQGPVAGRRRARERIDHGLQRLRSNSVGRLHKAGSYLDDKGRKVVIDDEGNKTVYDKKGRKLRPKKKPLPVELTQDPLPAKMSLHNRDTNNNSSFYDKRKDLLKSSMYESGRFENLWSDSPMKSPPMAPVLKGAELGTFNESPATIMTKDSAHKIIDGDNGPHDKSNDPSLLNGHNAHEESNAQIFELSQQVTDYGVENRDLKTKLMAAEDKMRTLTQQNLKEKSKNVKATTEMLQLKADYHQSSDEKRNLELEMKNLEARYREKEEELEKIANTPANRRIPMSGGATGGGDHLVTQISDLMAENDVLLVKLDLAKASSGHDVKKKDEQILFLNAELMQLREDNDMLFKGEAEKDPLMARLFSQKKELESTLKQEKEKASIRMDSMLETVDSLEKSNITLKKDLEKATLAINDDDDEDVRRAKEMAQAVAISGTGGRVSQIKRTAKGLPRRGMFNFGNPNP